MRPDRVWSIKSQSAARQSSGLATENELALTCANSYGYLGCATHQTFDGAEWGRLSTSNLLYWPKLQIRPIDALLAQEGQQLADVVRWVHVGGMVGRQEGA